MNEISCRVSSTIINYVKATRPHFVDSLIEGLPFDLNYLTNTDNWIPWDVEKDLEQRMVSIYDDEKVMFHVGRTTISDKTLGVVNTLLNLFLTPQSLIKYTPKIARYFTRTVVRISIPESTKESALMELRINGRQTRGACLFNQGMISGITELFGYNAAEIQEGKCAVALPDLGVINGVKYQVDENGQVFEIPSNGGNNKALGHMNDSGEFKIGGIVFGAECCSFGLKWENRKRKIKSSAGKGRALNDAMRQLEDNYRKLQLAYDKQQKSEERYKYLMENASDIICMLDMKGHITSINKKGLELIGYPPDEIMGSQFLDYVEEEYHENALKGLKDALNGTTYVLELAVANKTSGNLLLSINPSPIMQEGRTIGLMLIARDVTMDREISARLIEAERFAAKGIVAAEIAHEINNSLANIETALYIVSKMSIDENYRQDNLRNVYEEIERMSAIVKGILEVYNPDDSLVQSVDINNEIEKVINFTKRRLNGKGINVVQKLDSQSPYYSCYPGHIKQILLNLIKNSEEALKESSTKLIIVSTEVDDREIMIKVQDSGSGIPRNLMDNVTKQLFTTKTYGVGLGLSICKQLVEKYNGHLLIESEEERGAKVTIFFPRVDNA